MILRPGLQNSMAGGNANGRVFLRLTATGFGAQSQVASCRFLCQQANRRVFPKTQTRTYAAKEALVWATPLAQVSGLYRGVNILRGDACIIRRKCTR